MKNKNIKSEASKLSDPIVLSPDYGKVSLKRWLFIGFFGGFFAGWAWMTWAMVIEHPVGLGGHSFWRLLLPF